MCRLIPLSPSPPMGQQVQDPVDTQVPAGEAAIFLTPQNSNSAAVATHASCETTNNIPSHLPLPVVKSPLLPPKNSEGWQAANDHFHNILVPAILSATSLPEKYTTLTEGISNHHVVPRLS